MINSEEIKEKDNQYIQCVVDYAEVAKSLDEAVRNKSSLEELKNLIRTGIAARTSLSAFDRQNSGMISQRFESMIPHFSAQADLVCEYCQLAQDPKAIKEKFEVQINAVRPDLPPISLETPLVGIRKPSDPYAFGMVVSMDEMKKIASKLGGQEFQGVHLGKGLILIVAQEGDVIKGQISPGALRKISDILSHENYHALADIMGARAMDTKMAEMEQHLYGPFSQEPPVITAQDIRKMIDLILRQAKSELIPEAGIDVSVYLPGAQPQEQFKKALFFVFSQVWHPVKGKVEKLTQILDNPPTHWKIGDQEKISLKSQVASLDKLIMDRVGKFILASGMALSLQNTKLLFFASTYLTFNDFRLLPQVVEVINQRHPKKDS
jgi:hypothetical protein